MADSGPLAALEEIRGLVVERDALVARMSSSRVTVAELNAAQDKLAARVPRLLKAVEAILKLASEAKPCVGTLCTCHDCEAWGAGDPGYEDYKPHPGRVLSWKLDPAELREAIAGALTGEEKPVA